MKVALYSLMLYGGKHYDLNITFHEVIKNGKKQMILKNPKTNTNFRFETEKLGVIERGPNKSEVIAHYFFYIGSTSNERNRILMVMHQLVEKQFLNTLDVLLASLKTIRERKKELPK